MKVRVLGAFEVLRDGVPTTPSAPKPRRVLALLVVCGNSVVRADQIIDELWEDRPPLSATTTLQTYVYQLRKLLQPSSGTRGHRKGPACPHDRRTLLHTCPGGYLLELPPNALDAHRFEQLAERGRAELESGDAAKAAETLRSALQLWRGPALNDIGLGPMLAAEVVRLEESRKSTLELRIDAELELGRHHELIGELTGVVAQQPTHEGFWGKLILALYRAGRRSDALLGYQRARNALAGELGLEPSHELRRLHGAVLAADPSLAAPARPDGAVRQRFRHAAGPPNQLPPDVALLVGHDQEQASLQRAVGRCERSTPAVAVVLGRPGVGKSAFCVRTAHRLRATHPDGSLHASLLDDEGTPADPAEVLARFLIALGTPPDRVPERLEERVWAFRNRTVDRKLLIVLDDVARAEQLGPLLPSGTGCTVLITARRRIADPAIGTTVSLAPLSDEHGLDLLTRDLGRAATGAEGPAARELVALCGGLPLVLRTAARLLQMRPHWTVPFLVSRIRCRPGLLIDSSEDGPDLALSVRRSRHSLSPAADEAFGRLVATPNPLFSVERAAETLGLGVTCAEAMLEEMVEFQLATVEQVAGGSDESFRYRFPWLLQLAAAQGRPDSLASTPTVPMSRRVWPRVAARPAGLVDPVTGITASVTTS